MAKNNKTSKPVKKNSSTKSPAVKAKMPEANNEIQQKAKLNSPKQSVSVQQATVTPTPVIVEKLQDPITQKRLFALIAGIVFVVCCLLISFVYIPHVLDNTDEAIAAKIKKDKEAEDLKTADAKKSQLSAEDAVLKIDSTSDWKIAMDFKDFGTINLDLKKDYAPATVENFVRLASRKFFDGNRPHRIVEVDNFKVLQGGDPKGDGTGGETANGGQVPDELWKVAPEYSTDKDGKQVLSNTPELRAPSLYTDFNTTTGQITYRKGLILMAKTSAPNSATSQYFITLDKTILPADYTVFGTVEDSSMAVLDSILAKVKPIIADGTDPAMGGKPDPELVTTTVKIVGQS